MTDKTYNGWTNYATWRVNLEIFDDADKAELFDLTLDAWDLGHVLQDYVEGHIYEAGGGEGNIAVDYALAFLSDVNWFEIAKHMIDDAKAEDEAPTNLSNT
jgi:hypothetical protein